ncbi:MAG: hypothetical protein ACFB2Z_09150 [Maricaulaceae bacterium]
MPVTKTQSRRRGYASSRRPRNRRRGSSNPGRARKLVLLGSIPALVLIGGGFALDAYQRTEKIDADFCYARPDQAQHVLFLEASFTAGLSDQQERDYWASFEAGWRNAQPNTRFVGLSTARNVSGSIARPAFVICKPPANTAQQDALGVPGKPAPYLANQAAEAYMRYRGLTARLLADAQNPALQANESPILAQLQTISRYSGFQGPGRTLTVLTDGLNNSETAKFCAVQGDLPPFDVFARQDRYEAVRPRPFTGTDVNLLLVENGPLPQPGLDHCTSAELRRFWRSYFEANGAASVQLTRLRYGSVG